MPTSNPRLMIVVTPEQRDMLAELGKLQDRSAASFVRELVDAATPMFRQLLPVMRAHAEAIDGQPVKMEEAVLEVLRSAYGDDPAQLDMVEHINAIAAHMEAETAQEGRSDRSVSEDRTDLSAPHSPPSCNYGGQE
jgi:hypothetical protein